MDREPVWCLAAYRRTPTTASVRALRDEETTMADNSDLLALAAALERDADEIRALARPIDGATGPTVLAGGRLADSVDELIDLSVARLSEAAAALEAVAGQLRAVDVVDIDLAAAAA